MLGEFYKKEKPVKKQTIAALALMITLTFSMFAVFPAVSAHTPPISVQTYAYLSVSPDPIGIGQTAFIIMWIHGAPPTANGIAGDRYHDFTIEITKPDGTLQKLGPFTSDPTGSTYTTFTPSAIGTYKILFKYSGQTISLYNPINGLAGSASDYVNDTWLPCSTSLTLTVQQNAVAPVEDYPLPTEYWSRPIEGQNTKWASITSHWLGGSYLGTTSALWQMDGIAPNSPHIMWTKPIEFGGVVGGTTAIPGVGFYSGGAYEGRFTNAIIMAGKLYFWQPLNHASGDRTSASQYLCVDLQTGEQQWVSQDVGIFGVQSYVGNLRPTMKAQLFDYESMNQHGVVGGVVWEVVDTNWIAWDGYTGEWLYNLTKVPSGTEVYTTKGEIVRYQLSYNTTAKSGWLALWNNTQDNVGLAGEIGTSSAAYQWRPVGKTVDMSKAYSWNVTIPALIGSAAPSIVQVLPGDIILGQSSSFGRLGTPNPYTMWAISDKPATRGQLLWIKNYTAPGGDISRGTGPIDPVTRVFTMQDAETMSWIGYSLDTGEQLWGPVTYATRAFTYYGSGGGAGQRGFVAYGNLYVQGYGGELQCYNTKNGNLVWKYNNTNSGLDTPWGLRPIFVAAIADGKVYAFNNEHSPNTPLYKGQKLYCIDAYTGQELWTMLSWVGQTGGGGTSTSVLADGYLAYYNYYDAQVYCVGKGPSATTLTASPKVIAKGSSVLIEGTVTDQCTGAKGKAAVSDDSMAGWMEYLYMQKPIPANVQGVSVKLTAIDPNGNSINIATVRNDMSGMFFYKWTPPMEGAYKIVATFEGSNSYWPSYAETAVGIDAATPVASAAPTVTPTSAPIQTPAATATPSPAPSQIESSGMGSDTAIYVGVAAVVIIAVIAAIALFLRRRK
jgi:hypothetical protein